METDFFKYSYKKIAEDNEVGRCDVAHNRDMALRCFTSFLGKKKLPFSELSPSLMEDFEEWLIANGRKASTSRLYLNQISAIYNVAAKEGVVPKMRLLKGVKSTLPAKQNRELPTEDELHRLRDADFSDSKPMALARDLFLFCIYARGLSFTDMAHIKKSDVNGNLLTYTSQVAGKPRITVLWDADMQEIADRYPSDTEYLFPFIKSDNNFEISRDIRRVRENVTNAFKQIKTRCNLSVIPSMYMVNDIYQRVVDGVSVSKII